MTPRRVLPGVAVLVAVTLLLAGCRESAATEPVRYGNSGDQIGKLDIDLPERVLGLRVAREDVRETLAQVSDTYVEALSVYSLRKRKLLQATLQASQFGEQADYASSHFQETVVHGLGGQAPRQVRVGEHRVWLTTGTNQQLVTWFEGPRFYVLSIRQDYPRPRALLRRLLEEDL